MSGAHKRKTCLGKLVKRTCTDELTPPTVGNHKDPDFAPQIQMSLHASVKDFLTNTTYDSGMEVLHDGKERR